jgi:competence protein ComEC
MRNAGLRAFLAVVAGVILQRFCHVPGPFLLVFVAACLVAAFFTRGWSLLLGFLAASAFNLQVRSAPVTDIPYRTEARFEAVVLSEPIPILGSRTYAIELTRVRIGDRSYPLGLKAKLGGGLLHYGERISFPGALLPFTYPRNPGIEDLNEYYSRQGFAGKMSARTGIVGHGGDSGNPVMRLLVMPVRRHFIDVIGQHFSGTNRALLAGMLLGDKGPLPEETREAFQSAGIMYVLAVSGLHVAILVGVCLILLDLLGIRGLARLTVLVLVTFIYVGIAGFSAPALRAGFMCIVVTLGLATQRPYNPRNGLFVAGVAILVLAPQSLFDVGFQLSFAAALAILLFYEPLEGLMHKNVMPHVVGRLVIAPLAVSISACFGVMPLIAYYFYRIPVLSFLASVVAVFLLGIALPWGTLLMVVHVLSYSLTSFLSAPLNILLSALRWLSEGISRIPWSAPVVGRPSPLLIVWFYVLILLGYFALTRRWARKALLFTAVAGAGIWTWSSALQPHPLRVTFLDTIHGDATFVEFPDGHKMLTDAGSADDFWLPQFLRSHGVSRLDLLVVSHPHPHVCAGVENIVGLIPIRTCLVPIDSSGEPAFDSLIHDLKRRGTQVITVGEGDRLSATSSSLTPVFTAEFLNPTPLDRQYYLDHLLSANDLSLVLRLSAGSDTILMAGDLDNPGLIADQSTHANWLHAPHQGSVRSNSDLLLDSVRPRDVVVSGWYRLKSKFLDRCAARGITVHNLRANGALSLDLR